MRVDSKGQVISELAISSRTWIQESRVQRKNPTLERSSLETSGMEILERLSWRWPVWVKPNSSKGIKGRPSNRISLNRISARAVAERRARTVKREKSPTVAIFGSLSLWNWGVIYEINYWWFGELYLCGIKL